ncbi:hypothetical protein, partial [Pseudonocardia pini]|uniref:hypothetical protein n=1 Tax=Pseudonocardia pini TaxID=2758030 RepID=UPI0015F10001
MAEWLTDGAGDGVRVCALPGCDLVVESVPGRPERLYCCAAHRLAMRRLRRAAAHSAEDPAVTATLPWLREPMPSEPRPVRSTVETEVENSTADGRDRSVADAPTAGRSSWMRALARQKRTIAVLGATAILLGGYALTAGAPVDPSPPPSVAAPTSEENWASRAELALTAVSGQLEALEIAEQDWKASPVAREGGTPPVAVREMERRRQVLQQQRATLQSQLEGYRELERSTDELQRADEQLAAIDELLSVDTGRDQAWSTALAEQRELRGRHRDGVQQQVSTLREGVELAVRTPLPDERSEAGRTERITEEVRALGRGEPAPAPSPTLSA